MRHAALRFVGRRSGRALANLKPWLVYPRYWYALGRARRGYRKWAGQYRQTTLFVAGLPKSGTTWLEQMLTCFEGFVPILIPEATAYEMKTGGSHDYDLPEDIFDRFREGLVITKMHIHGSERNSRILESSRIRYVVLYRDLRDVAVSHFYFVKRTPWHPEYPRYEDLDPADGLELFANTLLEPYVQWVRSWHRRCDPELGKIVTYESLLENPASTLQAVCRHFDLPHSRDKIEQIIERQSFARLSGGRERGQENVRSFFRKGIAGDWENHFTPRLKERFKRIAGDFFVEFGYEDVSDW